MGRADRIGNGPTIAKAVPREAWSGTPARSVMIPAERLSAVAPDTPVEEVLRRMSESNVSQIPVLEEGRLLGMVGRDRLLALVRARMELKA